MTYEVGTRIDLSHLNVKSSPAAASKKVFANSLETKPENDRPIYDAGTQLIFRLVNGHFVTARKIHVAIA